MANCIQPSRAANSANTAAHTTASAASRPLPGCLPGPLPLPMTLTVLSPGAQIDLFCISIRIFAPKFNSFALDAAIRAVLHWKKCERREPDMEQIVQTLRLLRWGVVVLMVLRMVGKALECTLLLGGGLQEQLPYLAQYLIVAAFGFALLTLIADLLERRAGSKE